MKFVLNRVTCLRQLNKHISQSHHTIMVSILCFLTVGVLHLTVSVAWDATLIAKITSVLIWFALEGTTTILKIARVGLLLPMRPNIHILVSS